MKTKIPLEDRLWPRVRVGPEFDDCWIWTGALRNGYGVIGLGSRTEGIEYTHRIMFKIFGGVLLPGQELLHSCDNRPCCHPCHLSAGTRQDNVNDMMNKGRHMSQKVR